MDDAFGGDEFVVIAYTDRELFVPGEDRLTDAARERIAFQGLPARICWLGLGERERAGLAFNAPARQPLLQS